jgi:hypothetical protein
LGALSRASRFVMVGYLGRSRELFRSAVFAAEFLDQSCAARIFALVCVSPFTLVLRRSGLQFSPMPASPPSQLVLSWVTILLGVWCMFMYNGLAQVAAAGEVLPWGDGAPSKDLPGRPSHSPPAVARQRSVNMQSICDQDLPGVWWGRGLIDPPCFPFVTASHSGANKCIVPTTSRRSSHPVRLRANRNDLACDIHDKDGSTFFRSWVETFSRNDGISESNLESCTGFAVDRARAGLDYSTPMLRLVSGEVDVKWTQSRERANRLQYLSNYHPRRRPIYSIPSQTWSGMGLDGGIRRCCRLDFFHTDTYFTENTWATFVDNL